jgi:uncharacterized protein (TIRG00374 family)
MMSANCPLPGPTPAPPAKRWRDYAFIGGLLLLFLAGLIGIAAATGWEQTRAELSKLSLWQFGLLLLLSLANYGLRGLRWHVFTKSLGLRTTLGQNLRHFLGGFAMSVTPGRIGELVRMRWLARETGWSVERTAPLALVDRASDLGAMALLLGASASLGTGMITGAVPVTLLALAAAVIATRPALLARIVTLIYHATGRLPRIFARLRHAARSLSAFSSGGVLAMAMGLGLLGWAAEGYAFHLLLGWFGADLGLARAMAIFLFATLAGGLTGAPGGVGGAEAAMIALLAMDGVPLEVSLAATAIIRVTTLWFAVGIGMLAFPIAERKSVKVGS